VLVELVAARLGQLITLEEPDADDLEQTMVVTTAGESSVEWSMSGGWLWSIKSHRADPSLQHGDLYRSL